MLCQPLVRSRFAAWPWAARIRNPVLLKTASGTRQVDDASPGYHEVSIAAAHSLCNAAVGLRTAWRLTLWLLAIRLNPLERRNRAPDIAPAIATLTADRLQQQKRKHVFFKETARTGAKCFLRATSPAVEFLEKPAPRGAGNGSHGIPPGSEYSNPVEDAKSRVKVADNKTPSPLLYISVRDSCTCKAAFRHVKVRRRC